MNDKELCYKGIREGMKSDNLSFSIWALEHFVSDFPDFSRAYWDLAHSYMKKGNHIKAEKYYGIASRELPGNFQQRKEMADFYHVMMNDFERALSIYKELIRTAPFEMNTHLTAAHICVSLRRFDEAISIYEKILNLHPDQKDVKINLEKAMNAKKAEKNMLSEPSDGLYERAMMDVKSGRIMRAIDQLEELLKVKPEHANARNDLGVLYYQIGETEKTLSFYEKAVELSPQNINFLKNLADYYFIEMNREKDALDIYVRLMELNPSDVEVFFNTGKIIKAMGRPEDAKFFFEKGLLLDPENVELKKELEFLKESPSSIRDSQLSDLALSDRRDKAGEYPKNILDLKKKIEKYPMDASNYNDMGVMLYRHGERDQALFYYEKAVSLDSENAVYQKNLADFYFMEQGRAEDAMRIYNRILEKDTEDIETLMNFGFICLFLSKPEDAKFFFNRVMDIQPWNLEGQNALNRTEEILKKNRI